MKVGLYQKLCDFFFLQTNGSYRCFSKLDWRFTFNFVKISYYDCPHCPFNLNLLWIFVHWITILSGWCHTIQAVVPPALWRRHRPQEEGCCIRQEGRYRGGRRGSCSSWDGVKEQPCAEEAGEETAGPHPRCPHRGAVQWWPSPSLHLLPPWPVRPCWRVSFYL